MYEQEKYERPIISDVNEGENDVKPAGVVVLVVVAAVAVTVVGALTLVGGLAVATIGGAAHQTVTTITWESLND